MSIKIMPAIVILLSFSFSLSLHADRQKRSAAAADLLERPQDSLHDAVRAGDEDSVRSLLDEDAYHEGDPLVDSLNDEGDTPLIVAATIGDDSMVQLLLHYHPNVEALGEAEMRALLCAAQEGHTRVVRTLLRHGAQMNYRRAITPLHAAAGAGYCAIITALVEYGAEVNIPDDEGFTPLHEAALGGRLLAVETLLDAGAHPNPINPLHPDETPLAIAIRDGHTQIAAALLRAGAVDPRGRAPSALDFVTAADGDLSDAFLGAMAHHQNNGFLEMILQLEQRQIALRPLFLRALTYAVGRGDVQCVERLLEWFGTRVESLDPRELAPLLRIAVMNQDETLVERLIRARAARGEAILFAQRALNEPVQCNLPPGSRDFYQRVLQMLNVPAWASYLAVPLPSTLLAHLPPEVLTLIIFMAVWNERDQLSRRPGS